MLKSPRKAWLAIADTLEMLQGMPPTSFTNLSSPHSSAPGLCDILRGMWLDMTIDNATYFNMSAQIERDLNYMRIYLFRPFDWRARVAYARKQAEELRK
jgi:hypothetical protein